MGSGERIESGHDADHSSRQESQPSTQHLTMDPDTEKIAGTSEKQQDSRSADPTGIGRLRTVLCMFALCMATFLAALDMTIITTALPTIAAAFDADAAGYSWIGSSYLLAAAAATPTWGKLSDIFGRRPALLGANFVFFVGSLVCALSDSIGMLIAGRAVQGVGGGGLTVMTQICIGDLFSMRARAMFYGIVSLMWAFACGIGPILGGVFTQRVSWRWCFYVNLPCDGVAFGIIFLFVRIETPKTPFLKGLKAIDWLGSLCVIGGTVMLLLGLNFGSSSFPWSSATVICTIVFGAVFLIAFFVVESFVPKHPIMPLRLFNSSSNLASLLTCFFQSLVFISATYYLPIYFQDVLLASPILSGVYLLPFVISLALAAATSGTLIRKTGLYRIFVWFGMAVLTLGFGLFIDIPSHASWARIVIFQIIAGIGTGPNFQAPLIALQNRTEPRDIASATAAFLFARNLATAMSVVFGSAIFQSRLTSLVGNSPALPAAIKETILSSSTRANAQFFHGLTSAQTTALANVYTEALRDVWIFFTSASAMGLVVSLFIKPKILSDEHNTLKQGLTDEARNTGGTGQQKLSE